MGNIVVLNQETINQIAAGEVIERPFSVVKELVENAIDAGATAITVEIKEGGISFIRVTDNGCGFLKEDIPLAFLRHSTSKIRGVEDLVSIGSLGFRGEALSSIAAVARVELISCASGEVVGSRYRIEGGQEIAVEEVGAPEGTTFIVRDLFYNTPVRRKFLKTASTEGSYIGELMERMALSHPDISLRLIAGGQMKLHTAGNHNLKDIIYSAFGREITANLIPLKAEGELLSAEGYIGKPLIARGNRSYEIYFINGRYIKSRIIQKAVEDGYRSFLMQHKYPLVVLHLTVRAEFLDVNVHPTKMELRFRGEQEIYEFLVRAVRDALLGKELIPQVTLPGGPGKERQEKKEEQKEKAQQKENRWAEGREQAKQKEHTDKKQEGRASFPEPFEKKRLETVRAAQEKTVKEDRVREKTSQKEQSFLREVSAYRTKTEPEGKAAVTIKPPSQPAPEKKAVEITQPTLFDEKLIAPENEDRFQMIGQLFDTYWLVQADKEFLIIDQHAAHEKVLYERTIKRLEKEDIPGQQMAPPLILTLSEAEGEVIKENRDLFLRMGFSIEPFGGREYAVYSVPDHLYGIAGRELLLQMIDELAQNTGKAGVGLLAEKVASASCKAAVKGKSRLSFAEAKALLRELLTLENPYTCPHGRPTIISMSRYELEKKFKRVL
ncbi:MAG: DNA mismatch repair endonuclease MutL [Lachnospiraceae bacterium]|nr:DNA mismatch repair endonuclease MutL [Lachnospiraceae bacterium]